MYMNRKTLIIVAILIIIIGGVFFSFTNKAEAPKDQTQSQEGQVTSQVPALGFEGTVDEMIVIGEEDNLVTTITYTDNGFSPKIITISKDETVQFFNESSSDMWVASNIHPTHSLYPLKSDSDCIGSSFDQCASVPNGEVWEFTFTEIGTYGYHSHFRASKKGTVVVE